MKTYSIYGYPSGEILDIPEINFYDILINPNKCHVLKMLILQSNAINEMPCYRFLDENVNEIKKIFNINSADDIK